MVSTPADRAGTARTTSFPSGSSVGFTTFTITPEPFSCMVVLTLRFPVSPL